MRIRSLIFVVIVLMVANVAALGTFIYQRMSTARTFERELPPGMLDRPLVNRLKLSQEQLERMRASREKLMMSTMPMHQQLMEKRYELFVEIGKSSPDTVQLYALVEEIGQLQTTLQRQVVVNILQDGAILDPEQRQELLRMLGERMEGQGRKEWGGRRKPGRGI